MAVVDSVVRQDAYHSPSFAAVNLETFRCPRSTGGKPMDRTIGDAIRVYEVDALGLVGAIVVEIFVPCPASKTCVTIQEIVTRLPMESVVEPYQTRDI